MQFITRIQKNLEYCDIPVTISNIINSGRRTNSYVQTNGFIFQKLSSKATTKKLK